MIYGYIRVSTRGQAKDGNSLEAQEQALKASGVESIFSDTYTGATANRPQLQKLLQIIEKDDTVVVTKLDRIARSARQGLEIIDQINEKGAIIKILTMGTIDNTPIGRLMRTMLLGFAEFERDMIAERTQEGKRIAKGNPGFRDGRPEKFSKTQMEHALSLLENHSLKQVNELTGISVSTLKRHKRKKSSKD